MQAAPEDGVVGVISQDKHADLVIEAGQEVRSALGLVGSEEAVTVRRGMGHALASRFTEVTGGDAMLEWTAVATASALVLRRLGAGTTVLVTAGWPLPDGAPVLIEVHSTMTFREVLAATRATVAGAAGRAPSGDVLRRGSAPGGGLWLGPAGERPTGLGGLFVSCTEGVIEVHTLTVNRHLTESVATGIIEVLRQGLRDPSLTLADIGIVDDATRDLLIDDFNRSRDITSATPFRELVLQHATTLPDVIAIHDAHLSISYRELAAMATQIGVLLKERGLGPDDVVALSAPRNALYVAAAVGILFSGAAYLPVDPALPLDRREVMLDGVRAVISADGSALPEGRGPRTRFDFEGLMGSARRRTVRPSTETLDALLGAPPQPHDLAYVIFTSGSTGTPKGACLEHHSFLNFMQVRVIDCDLRPGVELPQTAPVSFDISVWQMFAPLTGGATVCVVGEDTVQDPVALSRMIADHRYEYVELVPTLIAVLLDQWAAEPALLTNARSTMRGLIATGEVLGVDLAQRWNAALPDVDLFNAYGPAECTDDVVQGIVGADENSTVAPIGRPLPNSRIYILDADLQLVPPGVTAEICVGGSNVGRGYFGRPDLTAAAFVPDPFAVTPGMRLYRTGDLGRWRRDGVLECLGRADTQVKVRGRRIELGEITHVLEAHPAVSRAAVVLVKESGIERLVAFAARVPSSASDVEVITQHLRSRLPDYMVPQPLVLVDELPTNRNGKVDVDVLRELSVRSVDQDAFVAARNETERTLADIWRDLFHVEAVGVHDDFYALGGDSIVSIRIVQEAKRRGIDLRPRAVLEARTVAALAAALDAEQDLDRSFDGTSRGIVRPPSGVAPLTPAQADFLRLASPEPDHWNSSVLYTLLDRRDLPAVRRAVERLAERHPALRTRFVPAAECVRQTVAEESPPVTVHDLAEVDPSECEGEINRLATALHTSLSLSDGPVCRVGLFLCGDDPDRIVVVAHHAVLDQYSWDVLSEDLAVLLEDDSSTRLPEPASSVSAWVSRLAEETRGSTSDRWCLSYWLTQPWRTGLNIGGSERGVEADLVMLSSDRGPSTSTTFLKGPRAGSPHTIVAQILTALGTAFEQWLGRKGGNLLIQLGGHGREDLFSDLDVTGTVGYLSTSYPFVLPLPGEMDAEHYLDEVSSELARVPAKGMGFGLLRTMHPDANVRRMLDDVPVPEVMFDFLGEPRFIEVASPRAGLGILGAPTHLNSGEPRAASHPRSALIEVRASIVDELVDVDWLFSERAIARSSVEVLVAAFDRLLRFGPLAGLRR